ncbi:hypothetical protein THH46_08025 [Pseudomonas sp. NA13]
MIGNRIFISSGPNTFASTDGVNWTPYFPRASQDILLLHRAWAFPMPLPQAISLGITRNCLRTWRPVLAIPTMQPSPGAVFALNNMAKTPLPANRGVGNPGSSFADSGKVSQSPNPLLWQTFAHRSELFPAVGFNHVGGPTLAFGSGPQYTYTQFLKNGIRVAPGADFTLYNNLDEATQIGQNAIFSGQSAECGEGRGNYAPSNDSQILFEAKANPVVYEYAKGLTSYPDHIVLPDGAVEVKAAWRKLADIPVPDRARYHTATVVTYKGTDSDPQAQNEDYALVALHIIHKTPNYPTFIFATFEHEDALTLPDGKSPTGLYYIANYNQIAYPGLDSSSPRPPPSPTATKPIRLPCRRRAKS